jgi:hypothetical protein
MLAEQAKALTGEQRQAILSGNVAALYRIDIEELAPA